MAPQHVGYIEDRWPTVRAGVENCKHSLEVAIQVNRRNCVSAELQEIVARVPPVMTGAGGKDCGLPGWHYYLLFSDLGAECSRFHLALLPLMEMHVERRTARSWRQGPIEFQDDLAPGVAHSAQPQDLSGVPVPDCHEVIHDCPPLTYQLRKLLAILSLSLQLTANRPQTLIHAG